MAESFTVEVWEYQVLQRQTWISDEDHAWTYKNFEKCSPPEDISLPSSEWCWATNWRIDSQPGKTDSEGWEYAGRFMRFKIPNRKSKAEKTWNSKARRRMWSRVMRREAGITIRSSNDVNKALPRVQSGLSSILQARNQIENLIKKDPDALASAEMKPLIEAVRKTIADFLTDLDQCDGLQPSIIEQAKIKKLRNDLLKEKSAIEKIINPSYVDMSKQASKRSTIIAGRQTFSGRDSALPGESFPRLSEVSASSKSGSISDLPSRRNPFEHDVEGDAMETPSSLADSRNCSPNPSFLGNDPKNGIVRGQPLISPADVSSKNNGVKGGTAGVFDPSVLSASSKRPIAMGLDDNWETPKDGVFLDRSMQEQMIEQVLLISISI